MTYVLYSSAIIRLLSILTVFTVVVYMHHNNPCKLEEESVPRIRVQNNNLSEEVCYCIQTGLPEWYASIVIIRPVGVK